MAVPAYQLPSDSLGPLARVEFHDRVVGSPQSLPLSLRLLMGNSPSSSPLKPDPLDFPSPVPRGSFQSSPEVKRFSRMNQALRSEELLQVDPQPPSSQDLPDVACVYFTTVGFCRNGNECRFSHQQLDSRPPLCKFYKSARGCHFGDSCRYSHETILCERVKVPESCLGALIGKNGTTRARLEAESRIENITIMTSSSEVVLTSRDQAGIQRASKLIMEVVKECELRQQSKQQHAAAASASPKQLIQAEGDIPRSPSLAGSSPGGSLQKVRRVRHRRRSQQPKPVTESPTVPQPVQGVQSDNAWHQCDLCRKSFLTLGALTDHQRAKGHLQASPARPGPIAPPNGQSPVVSASAASLVSGTPPSSPPSRASGMVPSTSEDDEVDLIDEHGRRVGGGFSHRLSSPPSGGSPDNMFAYDSDEEDHNNAREHAREHARERAREHVNPVARRGLFLMENPEAWVGSPVPAMGVMY